MLSEHFSIEEFTRSQTAARHGIDNDLPPTLLDDAIWFAETILEPIRELVDNAVNLTSGYRCDELNRWIGGSEGSYHIKARAGDMVVARLKPFALATRIAESVISFDKLILEFGKWVHVQGRREGPRGIILTADRVDGKTRYRTGIFN